MNKADGHSRSTCTSVVNASGPRITTTSDSLLPPVCIPAVTLVLLHSGADGTHRLTLTGCSSWKRVWFLCKCYRFAALLCLICLCSLWSPALLFGFVSSSHNPPPALSGEVKQSSSKHDFKWFYLALFGRAGRTVGARIESIVKQSNSAALVKKYTSWETCILRSVASDLQ